ncbi:MAG: ABC transporter substrate-binding protein [Chloroflexota bacterium]|nr:ABC transporter substrate-binding protein [Chloroflexota bacterium]
MVAATALLATAFGGSVTAQSDEPVAVCELAYYTGEFAPYGPSLTNDVVFPIEEVINLDPPLGRTWEFYAEDLGTVGEAQAARTCLEKHGAEIVVSIAHGYRTYRDYLMEYLEENDSPIGPSVHGGAIPGNLGGNAAEPIFRAQGLDEALGTSGSLYADSIGAEDIVIFATQVEGFQLAADAAQKGAEALGIEVLARIDVPAEQPSYRAEAQRIADLDPDAVIVQAGSTESATLIKQAAEAGLSLNWIGETGWVLKEFIDTLGIEPISSQAGIGFAAFSPDMSTPAWDFYSSLWNEKADTEAFGGPEDQYHFSTYDVMIQTALAVEAAGSYNASDWAPAMFEVGEGGEVCYTYADCLAMIREGKDIDYEGITGPGTYTDGGVNAVFSSYTPFNEDGTVGEAILLDAQKALDLVDQIKTEAVCDPADPPNECEW